MNRSFTFLVLCILACAGLFAGTVRAQVGDGQPTSAPQEQEQQPAEPPAKPQVQGTQYQQQQYAQPQMTKAELYAQIGLNIMQMMMAARQKAPQQRQRGENVKSTGCGGAGYHGRCDIYQFTNDDFPSRGNTCAQAAMATAMWTAGLQPNGDSKAFARNVFSVAPPKITLANLFPIKDSLGTDWHQVEYGLGHYSGQGIKYTWVDGEAQIKKYLDMNWPVMLMLDTGTLPQYNYQWWTGHWVTAFGYDKNYIYVSNFPQNRMTWAQLNAAFRTGTLAMGHGTAGKGLVVWK
jgi:hypothetical protein